MNPISAIETYATGFMMNYYSHHSREPFYFLYSPFHLLIFFLRKSANDLRTKFLSAMILLWEDSMGAWDAHKNFIWRRAYRIYRQFPTLFEMDELLSIAWMATRRAERNYDSTRGNKFLSYAGRAIDNALRKEISREIKSKESYFYNELNEEIPSKEIDLDLKVRGLNHIEKTRGGYLAWKNKVEGISLQKLSKETNIREVRQCIKSFQKKQQLY